MPIARAHFCWPYLNPLHSLSHGLVFAGLAPHPGGWDFHDCSPYRNHGRLTNMSPPDDWVWSPELNRYVLDFDGSNDIVFLSHANWMNFATGFSFACWLKTTALNDCYLAAKPENTFYISAGINTVANGKLCASLKTSSSSWYYGATAINDGVWHHCAVTYDGAQMLLYVDGKLDRSPAAMSGAMGTNGNPLVIGARYYSPVSYTKAHQACDHAFWNRACSDGEIKILATRDPFYGGWINTGRRVSMIVPSGTTPTTNRRRRLLFACGA